MKKLLATVLAVSALSAVPVWAQQSAVTRRDGFLRIWETIKRPVGDIRTKAFTDVPKDARGYAEIAFAKTRGILSDGDAFRPDDPLLYQDALLMLFRTRNVDDPALLTLDNLPTLLERYPIFGSGDETFGDTVSSSALEKLIADLDTKLKTEVHETSLYSEKFHGKGTAFGESFDMYAMTAAHRTFPYNTLVRVTNVSNGKSVVVRINDRGPFVKGRDMDMSLGSFTMIEERAKGKMNVTFERLGDVSLVNPDGGAVSSSPVSSVSSSVAACTVKSRTIKRLFDGLTLTKGMPVSLGLTDSVHLSATNTFTVTRVRGPEGTVKELEDQVNPGEEFSFTPQLKGLYIFSFRDEKGNERNMRVRVVTCRASQ